MTTAPDLTYYRRKLAGEAPPIVADEPQHGYYRNFDNAVVIMPGTGLGNCDITVNFVPVTEHDKMSDLWVGCAKNAVDPEIYGRWVETRLWPEQEALIKSSGSLNKDLHDMAALAKKAVDKLKARDAAINEEAMKVNIPVEDLRKQGVTTLTSPLEADTAAGYVQQIRAMVSKSEETIKLQIAPLKAQELEVKKIWINPFEMLGEYKDYFLSKLTEYGTKVKKESNDPDFKFAAGKAGDGKTIALRKKEILVLEADGEGDTTAAMKKLIKRFGKDEKVLQAYSDAIIKAANVAWKAEKKAPDGTKVETDYEAV